VFALGFACAVVTRKKFVGAVGRAVAATAKQAKVDKCIV